MNAIATMLQLNK